MKLHKDPPDVGTFDGELREEMQTKPTQDASKKIEYLQSKITCTEPNTPLESQ